MNKESYTGVYVFIEQREGQIQMVSLELLGKARQLADTLNQKVVAVLAGFHVSEHALSLIHCGADHIVVADAPELEHYTTEPYAQTLARVIDLYKPSILLIGATTIGRDLGPRLSARCQTGLTADCTRLEMGDDSHLLMTRPAFGGNLMATIVCREHRPQMATVRPGVMRRCDPDEKRTGKIDKITIPFNHSKFAVRLIKTVKESKGKTDITQARILISGGRGVGSAEGFEKLKELAIVLKAEVSASRALVDAGITDHNHQVGQTGKTVRPDLYLACGISGAIQHLAGMEESDFIVAINKDKGAPIFQVADVGIVGDVNRIIPLLTERMKR
ncbi:MAG: electron transfer flavoprotein subunit alpha/FixB family protein [Bacteroidetes bacterium HGW-Bacteroidetes-22]|nr:MAG: electron transfer flavoprotein subunit alpha/FixB family protein [Bacteroidetes bacterium HGW-Bacteroidetes-22]